MLNVSKRGKEHRRIAAHLYEAVVTRARQPVFFARLDVPDTLDGRFDLVTLHAWLVLQHCQTNAPLAQAFVDRVFSGFDEALREMGAGDIGIGRRMKSLADAFYGRLKAYEAADGAAAMAAALLRNLYRGTATPAAAIVANYVMRTQEHLRTIAEEDVDFGPLPDEDQA